jgi:hypothetical protein
MNAKASNHSMPSLPTCTGSEKDAENYMTSLPVQVIIKFDRFHDNSMLEKSKPHSLKRVQELEKVYMIGWTLTFFVPSEKSKSTFWRVKGSLRKIMSLLIGFPINMMEFNTLKGCHMLSYPSLPPFDIDRLKIPF